MAARSEQETGSMACKSLGKVNILKLGLTGCIKEQCWPRAQTPEFQDPWLHVRGRRTGPFLCWVTGNGNCKLGGNLPFAAKSLKMCITLILVPQSGVEPGVMAVEALRPNHWTAREFPIAHFFLSLIIFHWLDVPQLSIRLLKDILVASVLAIMNKASINTHVQIFV